MTELRVSATHHCWVTGARRIGISNGKKHQIATLSAIVFWEALREFLELPSRVTQARN